MKDNTDQLRHEIVSDDDLDLTDVDLSMHSGCNWIAAISEIGEQHGFAEPLGKRHHAVFVEDGDTLTLKGAAKGDGYTIGFGDCTGTVLPALSDPFAR